MPYEGAKSKNLKPRMTKSEILHCIKKRFVTYLEFRKQGRVEETLI